MLKSTSVIKIYKDVSSPLAIKVIDRYHGSKGEIEIYLQSGQRERERER